MALVATARADGIPTFGRPSMGRSAYELNLPAFRGAYAIADIEDTTGCRAGMEDEFGQSGASAK
jgi:hypothetical protein